MLMNRASMPNKVTKPSSTKPKKKYASGGSVKGRGVEKRGNTFKGRK